LCERCASNQIRGSVHRIGCNRTDKVPVHVCGDRNRRVPEEFGHHGNVSTGERLRFHKADMRAREDAKAAQGLDSESYRPEPVGLSEYLDGTHTETLPTVGALRADNQPLLYSGKWHTLIAPTTAGKTWFAMWQVKAVLDRGLAVAYAHFEEPTPKSVIGRLRKLGVSPKAIRDQFFWVPTQRPHTRGISTDSSIRYLLEQCESTVQANPDTPAAFVQLLVLDGIKAACTKHGWNTWAPEGVGSSAETLVYPATGNGVAVLSLGHLPKDRNGPTSATGTALVTG
jgi:hypothetical protein